MSQEGYVALTIVIAVFLLIVFFVSFILYVRQKPPKGCENLGRDESKCASCGEASCRFYHRAEKKMENDKKGDE